MRQKDPADLPAVDPIEETGCEAENDVVLLCYAETKDWRKCKKEVEAFKLCMERYKQKNINKRTI